MASRIVGGQKFRRALKRLPPECRGEIAKALDQSIKMVQATAIQLAPVRTGRLRKALASKGAVGAREKGLRVEFGFRTKALQRKVFYAHWIEYGRKGYSAGDKRLSGRSKGGRALYRTVPRNVAPAAARPFMRPALDINLPRIRRIINEAVRRAIRSAGRG